MIGRWGSDWERKAHPEGELGLATGWWHRQKAVGMHTLEPLYF